MSSNKTKRSAAWSRLFAGTLIGLAFVLMVVAGVNTRARNAGDERNQAGTEDVAVAYQPAMELAGQRTSSRKPQPPTPPQPDQPAQPPQPSQPSQSAQPPQPSQPSQPSQPPQPSQPSQPTPLVPSTPASAPNPISLPLQPGPAVLPAQFAPIAVPTFSTPSTPAAAPTAPSPASRPKVQKNGKGNLIEAPQPEYPVDARRDNVSGNVTVEIEIDEDGKVASAKAASGPDALRAAAVKAAYRARFKPAMANGKPVKVSATLSYSFVIADCNGPRCSEL